jgi:hypothetical protein
MTTKKTTRYTTKYPTLKVKREDKCGYTATRSTAFDIDRNRNRPGYYPTCTFLVKKELRQAIAIDVYQIKWESDKYMLN